MPGEVGCLDNVHLDFNAFSQSSINNQSLLSGRPYGGLSILWRKSLDLFVSVVDFGDNRLLGILVEYGNGKSFLLMNIYLPYFCESNYEVYLEYIGKSR